MRTTALKKLEMANPVRYGVPDSNAFTGAPSSSLRMHASLSTFTLDTDRNTDRVRQRVITYCAAAILEISLLAAIWVLLARPLARQPDDDSTAIEMVQAPPKPELTPP